MILAHPNPTRSRGPAPGVPVPGQIGERAATRLPCPANRGRRWGRESGCILRVRGHMDPPGPSLNEWVQRRWHRPGQVTWRGWPPPLFFGAGQAAHCGPAPAWRYSPTTLPHTFRHGDLGSRFDLNGLRRTSLRACRRDVKSWHGPRHSSVFCRCARRPQLWSSACSLRQTTGARTGLRA